MSKQSFPKWESLKEYLSGSIDHSKAGAPELAVESKYFNRNLSWLHFNDRVLAEAADSTVPAMERLRFLGIVSSNLDEFFMVRVAEVAKILRRKPSARFSDGLTANQVFAQMRAHVLAQKNRQAIIYKHVVEVLKKEDIVIHSDMAEFLQDNELNRTVRQKLPEIKILIQKTKDSLLPLMSERIHVFVRFPGEYAVIGIEDRAARLLELPSSGQKLRFALVEKWICANAKKIFKGREVIESFPFKIIRDADLRFHPDIEETLEDQIIEAVKHRKKAKVVRLEVDASYYSEGAFFLATALGLNSASMYRFDLPLDLRTLNRICNMKQAKRLLYDKNEPFFPKQWSHAKDIFELIRTNDILLHHPYDSFDFVIRFIQAAAEDPHVTSIHHTMYRTSKDSPIMEALKLAVKNGKKVTVYIEIKARFDELNNVKWANELRGAGARVVWPFGHFKVHSKVTQVMRMENDVEKSYLHLGTGNYHPRTARQYTDLGLLTCDPVLGKDVAQFFSTLPNRSKPRGIVDILLAPGILHKSMLGLIEDEIDIQKAGGQGHIIAKMNSLVDPETIQKLYEASSAGVKIELIVRGICCLRPGIKGLSENIHVISIIDRFLEHSRIYYFRAGGQKKLYLSSADWMPRNFFNRFELAFPIKDPILKKYIHETILKNSLAENVRGWILNPEGTYSKVSRKPSDNLNRSQYLFETVARNNYQGTVLENRYRGKNIEAHR